MARRRRFGRVRALPSGRYQARYQGPDGIDRPAPDTFPDKTSAERWLTLKEAEIISRDWLNPDAGRVLFKEYAEAWVKERPGLRLKTVERYECVVRLHLAPILGGLSVAEIKEPHVRRWRKKPVDAGVGEATIAKAYRLLKAIMNTSVGDELVKRNPCQIKGRGAENAAERPVQSIAEVYVLAVSIEPRFHALALLTVFANLRWGEAVALRRKDLDLETRTVRIERTLVKVAGSPLHFGPPKTDAGVRKLPIPKTIVDELRVYLKQYAQDGEDGLIFVGAKGAVLRGSGFRRIWSRVLAGAGLKGIYFHDLRHTGSTLAAIAGATLPELKERMGHASDRAAVIYLHATQERHQEIVDTLSAMTKAHLKGTKKPTGTRRARKGKKKS